MPVPTRSLLLTARLLTVITLLILVLCTQALPARAQDGTTHIVVPGDTLSEIAVAYGTDVATLRALNGITGNLIRIGQELKVGNGARGAAARPAASSAGSQRYTVKQGDNLSRIAARFDVTVAAILEANNIANPRLIAPGQSLVIPTDRPLEGSESAQSLMPPEAEAGAKWIDVDLSGQRVVAYEGTQAVKRFRVSTGLPATPTVTGTFRIRLKMPVQDMSGGNRAAGDDYELKGVQWVQYFYADYAFHGTYWHANFGYPASRGCINMSNPDAEWLFRWAGPTYNPDGPLWQGPTAGNPGTLVIVHE